ncbi:hypothetical protein BYT27DRAFT_7210823 [Phlegmacium glaucopus]|nr:hypothetical protein BYT27DRAFT_7210823 [Phlegmacium glaucopus]
MLHHLFSLTLLAVLALLSSAFPTPVVNGTLVNLRIEGSEKTIFEGTVFTRGHNVTTVSGGTHHCDGTNNHANLHAGPTCTSALDDAAKVNGFTFDGRFFALFDDFLLSSIDGEATQFWGIILNFWFIPVGGCQQEVKFGDEILFAFDAFKKVHFLKLSGPLIAYVGQAGVLTVTDGQTGLTVAGALVNGKLSDANGQVSVTFSQAGVSKFKAEKADSIRSNQLLIPVIKLPVLAVQ